MQHYATVKERAYRNRQDVIFQPEDLVMLYLEKRRRTGAASKLLLRCTGPFRIIQRIGENAYELDMPEEMRRSPVVNVKLLFPYHGETIPPITLPPLPGVPKRGDRVDEVLERNVCHTTSRGRYVMFKVRWVNQARDSWIPEATFRQMNPVFYDENIVSTVNLDCKLVLTTIALRARNAEYNPKRFAAVIMRIREPKTTALIFASGKMVCTGAKSEHQSKLAARKYARIVQKLGFAAKFKDFKIQNIVGSCDVKFPIRLEGLAYSHGAFSSYEPEIFPGLIYRMKQPKVVLLIFVSGKIVITGAKMRDETYTAFENIYPVLSEFKRNPQ
ncbi:hypothetical protein GIB67_000723 [Kingdonia uniflora]|uniref:Tf2-1-like SH3-like domain-containing protein n=1 Tax=Kingdonia uniflora TaxID=39325 RepID=A0A7J7ND12_9MAGN|nr:hypothetical protein GIB67_000723 [Kingdonia uniflora]